MIIHNWLLRMKEQRNKHTHCNLNIDLSLNFVLLIITQHKKSYSHVNISGLVVCSKIRFGALKSTFLTWAQIEQMPFFSNLSNISWLLEDTEKFLMSREFWSKCDFLIVHWDRDLCFLYIYIDRCALFRKQSKFLFLLYLSRSVKIKRTMKNRGAALAILHYCWLWFGHRLSSLHHYPLALSRYNSSSFAPVFVVSMIDAVCHLHWHSDSQTNVDLIEHSRFHSPNSAN